MAGRPLMRAKKFADWEDRLWGLLMEFCDLAPNPPVRQRTPDGIDFWAETFQLLQHTTIAASVLRYELEHKAGLDAESLEREREVQRGLREMASGAGEVAEHAEQAATETLEMAAT